MASRIRLAAVAAASGLVLSAPPAQAQLFWNPPDFRGSAVTGDEPGVTLPLPGATRAEINANLLWNLRAGLNVAALQCQFAPSLLTVRTYNEVIAHHSKEFNGAFQTLVAYFKKQKGPKLGQTAFDQYTTSTYNGFSTLHGQLGFCQTAASIGRAALGQAKGDLLPVAQSRLREFRNSLVPAGDSVLTRTYIAPFTLPAVVDPCLDKKGRVKKGCRAA